MTIAMVLFVAMFNTFLARHLPLVEGLVLFLHLAGFFAIIVPLWVLGPRTPSSEVWTGFVDEGGWGNGKSRPSLFRLLESPRSVLNQSDDF
jgi:choline transport protein